MRTFICSLRSSNYATYSGCSVIIGENGIKVSHLFFANLLEIPYENIIKIIQFNNRRMDIKIEYNNGLMKKEIVHLRVNKKAFISYAISLGIEVETQDKFIKEKNKEHGCLLYFIVIAFVFFFTLTLFVMLMLHRVL